jgi:hypothetical protein
MKDQWVAQNCDQECVWEVHIINMRDIAKFLLLFGKINDDSMLAYGACAWRIPRQHARYPKDKYITVKREYNNGDNQNRLCCSITSLITSCWFLPSIATVQFVPEHVSYIMGTHYFNLYQVCYFFQSKCYHLYKDWIWINTELSYLR